MLNVFPFFVTRSMQDRLAASQTVARHKIAGAGIMRGLEFVNSGRYVPTSSVRLANR